MRRIRDREGGSSIQSLAGRTDELESVLGVSGIGFCHIDRNLAVVQASSQFKSLFGLAPDASVSLTHVESAIVADDREKLASALRAAFDHGEDADFTLRTSWS